MPNCPYQVTQDDIDRSSTLDQSDLNRWYVLVSGTMQFVRSQEDGKTLVQQLRDDLRAIS
jgi:hypothetical protein